MFTWRLPIPHVSENSIVQNFTRQLAVTFDIPKYFTITLIDNIITILERTGTRYFLRDSLYDSSLRVTTPCVVMNQKNKNLLKTFLFPQFCKLLCRKPVLTASSDR